MLWGDTDMDQRWTPFNQQAIFLCASSDETGTNWHANANALSVTSQSKMDPAGKITDHKSKQQEKRVVYGKY